MKAERVADLYEQRAEAAKPAREVQPEGVSQANGYVRCGRCGERAWLYPDTTPAAVRSIVRAFTADHAHGSVTVVTPHGSAPRSKALRSGHCTRCRGKGHNARTRTAPVGVIPDEVSCSWCGAASTTIDEDGDPACAQHANQHARPEAIR